MRTSVKALFLSFLATCAWGTPTFVQSTWCSNGSGASGNCVFAGNVTAGNLIVVGCGGNRQTGVVYAVTDNAGDSFTLIGSTTTNSNGTAAAGIWYAYNATGGATTVICQDTKSIATWIQQSIHEYSGVSRQTDPFDVSSASAPAAALTVTQMVTSSATTTGNNELMFSYCNFGIGSVTSQSGTLRTNNVDNAYMASQDTVLASPTLYQSYFNDGSNSASYVCLQAAFKPPTVPIGYIRWE